MTECSTLTITFHVVTALICLPSCSCFLLSCTCRDAIVSSLGGVALAAQETAEDLQQEEGTIAVEIAASTEISTIAG